MKPLISMLLPIKTVSEANKTGEHWRLKHRRHNAQNTHISLAFMNIDMPIPLPCLIRLTRIAPRFLDFDDNLRMAFKWIKDSIADEILPGQKAGRADSDTRIKWDYHQEKGKSKEYAVRIEIYKYDVPLPQVEYANQDIA